MSTSTSPSPISTLAKRPLSRPAPLWRRNSQSAIAGESSSTPWVTRFASRRSSLIDEESSEFSGTTAFGSKATFQEKLRNREPFPKVPESLHMCTDMRESTTPVHYVGE